MKKLTLKILLVLLIIGAVLVFWQYPLFVRLYDSILQLQASRDRTKWYELSLPPIEDITAKLSADETIPVELRAPLIRNERKIVVFTYRSDGNDVAGYLSYLTVGQHPTILFLRGGNGYLGIMRPNNPFSFIAGHNVIGTLYRGNIYGGEDELGGQDINDVENLIKFIPALAKIHTRNLHYQI